MATIELCTILFSLTTTCIRTSIGEIQRSIIAQCGNHLSTEVSDHLSRSIMAKGPITDNVHERAGGPDHLQDTRARLLDETQIRAQLDVAPLLVFAPFRAAPFPRGCFLGVSVQVV